MTDVPSNEYSSQLTAQLNQAKGQMYETIGNVTGSEPWKESGEQIEAQAEDDLKGIQGAAAKERLHGKVQSAWGMLTGDSDKQNEGNLNTEKGEWKGSLAEGKLPNVSGERMQAKVDSAIGMVTGDQQKQNEANMRAEKAEWTKG